MKKAIVLAGGFDQIALINELKSRGYFCILIDYYTNPPAKIIADKHYQESTLDFEAVRRIALLEHPEIIVTACTDQALVTMAKVSEDLKIPCYLDYQTAKNVTDKKYMKAIMASNDIPTARHISLDKLEDLNSRFELDFPVVVKPADCNSSKGVKKVSCYQELQNEVANALSLSRTHKAIIEEFKEGRELSADFFIKDGEALLLGVSESTKIPNNGGSFTITGSLYPVTSEDQNKALTRIAEDIAHAFGLKNTPLLVQFIQSGSEFFVIEFSARMGGGSKYELIKQMSGVDIMKQYVNFVLGEKIDISPALSSDFLAMKYIYCYPGILEKVKNLDANKEAGNIAEYFIYKTKGMAFEKAETSSDRAAGYLVSAQSREELNRKITRCDESIKVIDPQGHDLMIHNLI